MKSGCGFSFGNGCGDGNNSVNLFGAKAKGVRQVIPVTLQD
jgi:nitrate reductase beta subunit